MPRRRRNRPTAGRKTLLDVPKKETLLAAIRAGNRLPAAAAYAGVSPRAVQEWLRRGEGNDSARAPKEPYITFAREVRQARAHAEVWAVSKLRSAMGKDARSTIWWLENTTPEWRRQTEAAATMAALPPPAQPQNFILISGETLRRLSDEQLAEERGEADVDDAARARRAKLVTDSASP